jgi:hypothetical protein
MPAKARRWLRERKKQCPSKMLQGVILSENPGESALLRMIRTTLLRIFRRLDHGFLRAPYLNCESVEWLGKMACGKVGQA